MVIKYPSKYEIFIYFNAPYNYTYIYFFKTKSLILTTVVKGHDIYVF